MSGVTDAYDNVDTAGYLLVQPSLPKPKIPDKPTPTSPRGGADCSSAYTLPRGDDPDRPYETIKTGDTVPREQGPYTPLDYSASGGGTRTTSNSKLKILRKRPLLGAACLVLLCVLLFISVILNIVFISRAVKCGACDTDAGSEATSAYARMRAEVKDVHLKLLAYNDSSCHSPSRRRQETAIDKMDTYLKEMLDILKDELPGADKNWLEFGDRYYLVVNEKQNSWLGAKRKCERLSTCFGSATLAAVTSPELDDFLRQQLMNDRSYCIGLRSSGGCSENNCLSWTSGDPVDYTNWAMAPGTRSRDEEETSGDYCGEMSHRAATLHTWSGISCHKQIKDLAYICQWAFIP